MDDQEILWIATVAIRRNMDYEKLYYSDYMYDNPDQTDKVWELVEECKRIGTQAFNEKYQTDV